MLQVDVKNTFNTVAHDSILHNSVAKVPTVYNWLAWCHKKPCPMYSQGRLLTPSKPGVHQGDAMGPLGFALGLEGAPDKCAESEKALEWATWYLDDGTIIGSPESVGNYLKDLILALTEIGLEVNIRKCQL